MIQTTQTDVVIIGAGPSGSIAACLLRQLGHEVVILEKMTFPRFIIGESLLPQCLTVIEKAGCLEAIKQAGFQKKIGATFQHQGQFEHIVFDDKFSAGPGTAFHVQRGKFDKILADCAERKGATLHYQATVIEVEPEFNNSTVVYKDSDDTQHTIKAKFIIDASGYGRVLPRLLAIDKPSSLEPKGTLFTHIKDNITEGSHSREETLIVTHPQHRDVWYWLISFSDGRSSLGCVGSPEFMKPYQEKGIEGLKQLVNEDDVLAEILKNAEYDTQDYIINAYSGSVSKLYGDGFAILGNAGEFLDPVFSSGVTAALQSADLAVNVLDKMLKGQAYDWQKDFVDTLSVGIEAFRCFVNNWYTGGFQDVIYTKTEVENIRSMIASILAGYAWDTDNPFVSQPNRRLNALIKICQD